MESYGNDKVERVLSIYTKLIDGYVVNKAEMANDFGVNERSIQRDIEDIRSFMDKESVNSGLVNTVVYYRKLKGYRLETYYKTKLSNGEVLAICKILLDSRAFTKEQMMDMLDKLIANCVPASNRKLVQDLIRNEAFHYVEPRHKSDFLGKMWQIGQAIREYRYIEIDYVRPKGGKVVHRTLKPVAIMFSEYYFYLTAFIDDDKLRQDFEVSDDAFPTIYRIDRIKEINVSEDRFHIPYRDRFEEGEFRKRIQFMYGGKLQRVKFRFTGYDIDSILDRLPTAKILDHDEDGYIITAEVFGTGIDMWLRSQGELVELL